MSPCRNRRPTSSPAFLSANLQHPLRSGRAAGAACPKRPANGPPLSTALCPAPCFALVTRSGQGDPVDPWVLRGNRSRPIGNGNRPMRMLGPAFAPRSSRSRRSSSGPIRSTSPLNGRRRALASSSATATAAPSLAATAARSSATTSSAAGQGAATTTPTCARSAVPTTMPEKKTTSESGAAAAELIGPGGLYAEASALAPKPATSSRAEILGWHENKRFFQNGP